MRLQPWRPRRAIPAGRSPWRALEAAWGISAESARLAWLRGLDRPEDLAWRLDPSWERTWDPFLMPGMAEAVARIRRAIQDKEPICIYGDYDADGVTATALLFRVLERLGASPAFFIPNRFGYGLHLECIRDLAATHRLAISVDCGVRSPEEVAASRAAGMDWVITDHHALGPELPGACAVLHPGLGSFPNPHLSGVGVAFKLSQALLDAVPVPRGADATFLDGLLKLVALGTLADMVPLAGENALLVKRGLKALGGGNGAGLASLLRAAKVEGEPTARQVAFQIAPRLNAVGRMGGAEDAVRLLLARDPEEASSLAARMERLNVERRGVQRELLLRLPPPDGAAFDLVVDASAHKGVLGIVAGQRMRDTGLPTGVCTVLEGMAQGSLRAPEGYDLGPLLDRARPFLRSGGGHRSAAGITFELARLPFVREAFVRGAAEQAGQMMPISCEVDGASVLDIPPSEGLRGLEPFGQGFPEPTICLAGLLERPPLPFGEGHCKLRLSGHGSDLVWFNADGLTDELAPSRALTLALTPQDHPRWGRSWHVKGLLESEAAP